VEHTSGPANRSGLGVFHVSLFGLVTTSILSNGSLYQIPLKANGSHNRQKQACQSAVVCHRLISEAVEIPRQIPA
jgi:hypothetical protein